MRHSAIGFHSPAKEKEADLVTCQKSTACGADFWHNQTKKQSIDEADGMGKDCQTAAVEVWIRSKGRAV
jgi:hypothetical protein